MADMSMSFMRTCMIAADKKFESDQKEWAAKIRRIHDRKTKKDSVSKELENLRHGTIGSKDNTQPSRMP